MKNEPKTPNEVQANGKTSGRGLRKNGPPSARSSRPAIPRGHSLDSILNTTAETRVKHGLGRTAQDLQAKREAIPREQDSNQRSILQGQPSLRSTLLLATRNRQSLRGLGKNRSEPRLQLNQHQPLATPGAEAVGGRSTRRINSREERRSFTASDYIRQHIPLDASVVISSALVEPDVTSIETTEDATSNGCSIESGNGMVVVRDTACVHDCWTEVLVGTALPIHTPNNKTNSSKSIQKWICLVSILLAVGVVMILSIIFTVGMSDGQDSEDLAMSAMQEELEAPVVPQELECPPFYDGLPLEFATKIKERGTPEYQANQWMCNDPHLKEYPPERQFQRFAMVDLFYSTDGPNWYRNDHWLDYQVSECDWYSSYVENDYPICDEESRLLVLDYHSNNLRGPLPGLPQFYPRLLYYNLADNSMTGPPPRLYGSSLSSMEVFIISRNKFEGPITTDAGFYSPSVRVVKVDGNALTGYINPVFAAIPNIEVVNLTSNAFTGEVPFEIESAKKLQYLGMGDNQWYGTLPTELGTLTDLQEMHWQDNVDIIGSIPSELGLLTSLQTLNLDGTHITGSIPEPLCELGATEGSNTTMALEIVVNCSRVECCA